MDDTVPHIVNGLAKRGVSLTHSNGQLSYAGPKGALTPDDIATLKAHKQDIIDYLDWLGGRIASYLDQFTMADGGIPITFQQDGYRKFYKERNIDNIRYSASTRILTLIPLKDGFETSVLEQALTTLCAHNDILRAELLSAGDEKLSQTVHEVKDFTLGAHDLSGAREGAGADPHKIDGMISSLFREENYPLFNACVAKISPGQSVLAFLASHLITDAWSSHLIARAIETSYASLSGRAAAKPRANPFQYTSLSVGQKDAAALFNELIGWDETLRGAPQARLPAAHALRDPGLLVYRDEIIDQALIDRLQPFIDQERCTLTMVMLAAYVMSLAVWSAASDLTITATYHGRSREAFDSVIGMFAERLPIRSRLRAEASLAENFRIVRSAQMNAWDLDALPAQGIVDILDLPPSIMQIVFNSTIDSEPRPGDSEAALYARDAGGDVVEVINQIHRSYFARPRLEPMNIEFITYLSRASGGVKLKLGRSERFSDANVDAFLAIYREIIGLIATSQDRLLGDLNEALSTRYSPAQP